MRGLLTSILTLCVLTAGSWNAAAQAPSISDVLTGRERESAASIASGRTGARGVQPSSQWLRVGAQMGYLLDGSGTIADDFLASGRVEIGQFKLGQPSDFKIPLISNIGALGLAKSKTELEKGGRDLLASAKGLSLGVSPYRTYGPEQARTTLYASAAWKLNTGRDKTDTTQTVTLHQGRFSVGIGMDAKIIDGATMPVTFSIEPVYTVWNASRYKAIYGVERSAITSLELTAILPLKSIGLLAQTNVAQAMTPAWRIGLLLFTPSDSSAAEKAAAAAAKAAEADARSAKPDGSSKPTSPPMPPGTTPPAGLIMTASSPRTR